LVRAESEEDMKPKREPLGEAAVVLFVGVVCCEDWLRGVLLGVWPAGRDIEPRERRARLASEGAPGNHPLRIPRDVGDWPAPQLSPVSGISTSREPSGPLMVGERVEDEVR
jgi:hypothetical protein